VLRFRFNCVKAVPASGDAASCAAAGADALWSAVVGKQEYGQYRWQPVAAYVADMVHLHFWPSSKLLNFTDEVRAEVSDAPGFCQLEVRSIGKPPCTCVEYFWSE
jgi:hypothetical protein